MVFHALTVSRSRRSCLNTRPLGRVFKYLPRDPAIVYCDEIAMDDHCSCRTYDSNGKLWRKRPKAPYKLHINSSNATENQHGGWFRMLFTMTPVAQSPSDVIIKFVNATFRAITLRYSTYRKHTKAHPVISKVQNPCSNSPWTSCFEGVFFLFEHGFWSSKDSFKQLCS